VVVLLLQLSLEDGFLHPVLLRVHAIISRKSCKEMHGSRLLSTAKHGVR